MFYIKFYPFLILFLYTCLGFSQDNFSLFSEPSVALNYGASNRYKGHFSFKGREYIYNESQFFIKQRQLEINHFSTWSFPRGQNISVGVLFRNRSWFEASSNEVRLTGQFGTKSMLNHLRIGHRFRLETRFFDTITILRLRHRFAIDFALNGEKLDIGEAYLIATTEFLWSLSPETPLIDNRTGVYLGWYKTKQMKLQIGLEHQLNGLNQQLMHSLYVLPMVIFNL
ncbi:DUF2490 domain-containing protein [Aestuariivivens sediminicola]|uniref:DUF2490 domain-containing protein n=1 Tax=Aestuariivivens sediminicola TaxID=2913560 RepID=UPI001F57C39A|nr:DUF2490 domain-containing protein [Aestuariivivens sediminicola]